MNLINELTRADTVRVTLSCHYRVDTDFPIPTIEGDKTFVKCFKKTKGSLSFNLNADNFNLPPAIVVLNGVPMGSDTDGNPLVLWSINQNFNPAISYSTLLGDIHFSSVRGSLLTALFADDPFQTGAGCDNIERTFVCSFQDSGNGNTIVVTGDNGTTVTLSNIKIVSNVGLTTNMSFQIIPHHNHHNDCSEYFDFVGEEVSFRASATTIQLATNLQYKWNVIGATPVGLDNLSSFKIQLPETAGIAHITVEITDLDTGISDYFTHNLRFYSLDWSNFFYLSCELRKLMQQRYIQHIPFDPGDPAILINPADNLHSVERLSRLLITMKELESSIKNIMSQNVNHNLRQK